jgi:hypothetical protein
MEITVRAVSGPSSTAWASARSISWPVPARWSSSTAAIARQPDRRSRADENFCASTCRMAVLGMAGRAHRRLHHLSLVSRVPPPGTANLALFPQRLLMSKPHHQRLALHRHGVEGARGLARAHLHHHGRGGLRNTAAISRNHPELRAAVLVCVDLASRRGHRRLLRRHDQQECACRGRPGHPHRSGRTRNERSNRFSAPQAKSEPERRGRGSRSRRRHRRARGCRLRHPCRQIRAAIKSLMNFWKPTGPLSGVTTCAIVLSGWRPGRCFTGLVAAERVTVGNSPLRRSSCSS